MAKLSETEKHRREKISVAVRKRWADPAYKQRVGKLISKGKRRSWQDPEIRERTLKAMQAGGFFSGKGRRGKSWSAEVREKMSQSAKGRDMSKAVAASVEARKNNPQLRERFIAHCRKLHADPEIRKKRSQAMRRKWREDSVFRNHMLEHLASIPRRGTSIELTVQALLNQLETRHMPQRVFKLGSQAAIADFYLPDYNIVIECDGSHWHSSPAQKRRDRFKDQLYRRLGLRVIRLRDKEIENNLIENFLRKLEQLT